MNDAAFADGLGQSRHRLPASLIWVIPSATEHIQKSSKYQSRTVKTGQCA